MNVNLIQALNKDHSLTLYNYCILPFLHFSNLLSIHSLLMILTHVIKKIKVMKCKYLHLHLSKTCNIFVLNPSSASLCEDRIVSYLVEGQSLHRGCGSNLYDLYSNYFTYIICISFSIELCPLGINDPLKNNPS